MSDLADFLRARYGEDEAAARAAASVAGPDWTWRTDVTLNDETTDYVTTPDGVVLMDTMGGIEDNAPHVARHDPARVLRETGTRRHRLARYLAQAGYGLPEGVADGRDPYEKECDAAVKDALKIEVLEDAAIWRDHPDYDPAWAPDAYEVLGTATNDGWLEGQEDPGSGAAGDE